MEPLQLTPAQALIASDPHRFRILCCGRRFGKTTLAIDQIKACAALRPNARIAYIAPTYQQARDIAWEQLKRDCKEAASSINESRLEIRLVNGSLIVLRGWESIETLRGQKFDLVVLDEVAMYRAFWSEWQEVIRPTLTDTKGEGLFISSPKGFNHFYDLYNLEATDSDYKSFHFTSYDNPYLPTEEIEKARKELTEDRFAQEYLADFRKTEGLVYKEFDRTRHLFDELPQVAFIETIAGVDFGFTHPASVPTVRKDFDGNYWITEEWFKTGQTDALIAEYVASKRFNKVFPDPENAGGIQELKNRGVNVREVIKGPGSVKSGINVVRELLKANRLHVHRSCYNIIQGFETYSYPPRKPGASHDDENPLKENDDAMDSIRYPLMMDTPNSQGMAPIVHYTQHKPYGINRLSGDKFLPN